MVFSSLFFLYLFLPLCLLVYWLAPKIEYKNNVLLLFSLIFYAWGEPLWVLLLVFSATANYLFGLLIEKYRGKAGAKTALVSSLVLNLGLLFLFKYSAFTAENINALFSIHLPVPNIRLPIGISFYTFQTISYVVDCYWDKIRAQRSYSKFLLYVSMFPQLVAGPIVRYSTIEPELSKRYATAHDISEGLTRIMIGLGKKVILSNHLSTIVDAFFTGDLDQIGRAHV